MLPRNWSQVGKFLNFREKVVVVFLALLILGSLAFWLRFIYFSATVPVPKRGGEYYEGVIGQPIYINPLLSQTSEADSDLVQVIYSGILKYDSEGKLVNDLAEKVELSEDQKTYTVTLRQNAVWHDNQPLTAADVDFTMDIIQDPAYKSPLRQNWQGVEVNKKDDLTLEFVLKNPFSGFLSNLTVGILPRHIWENISAEKFSLADYNLRPIGSGPYMYSKIQKNSNGEIISYELDAFKKYYQGEPFISRVVFTFYPEDEMLIQAFNKKEIKGMGNLPLDRLADIKNPKSTIIHEFVIPRYYALFLNQTKSIVLANDNVRKALTYALDREALIREVLQGKGSPVYGPLLSQMPEFNNDSEKYPLDVEKAKNILEEDGWKMKEDGVREKDGKKLSFQLYTVNWPELDKTARVLARQWEAIGVKAEVNVLSISDIQQNYIRPREYEALLFGQIISFTPDLYSFWHSSEKQDPGLNLALFDNKKADTLMEEVRQLSEGEKRTEKFKELQNIIAEKIPALFLYSPAYVYPVSNAVKGVELKAVSAPAWRFGEISQWYLKTKRVKK